MFYTSEPEGLREFLRDKLGLKANDIGGGWLIFDLPEADMGCHPADDKWEEGAPSGTMDISFYCDDIQETVRELKAKGVEFEGELDEQEWGFMTRFRVPGNFLITLYQPKYRRS